MNLFELEILACEKPFFKEEVEMIIVPSIDGQLGILANHMPAVIALDTGNIRIKKSDGEWKEAVIGDGMAEISENNKVTLLVDFAEKPEDIDIKRAEEAKERAEEQMRQKQSIMEYHQSKASLARAMARLSAANKITPKF